MPKVEFKRVETDEEVENINIKDGQLIYSKTGKTFMDYGNERIPTGSGGGSVEVDTEMSDTSENAVQNKVIKEYVDGQIDSIPEEVIISDTQPTGDDWKLWINSDEVGSQASEITNEYSESTGLGYSANYVNNINTYSTTEEVDTGKVWIDGKKIYRKVFTGTTPNSASGSVNFNNNIDTLVSEDLYFLSGSNYYVTKGYYEGTTPQFSYVINKSTSVYFSVLSTTARNMSFYLIMEYTKP